MKIYIPNKDYLIPKIIDTTRFTGYGDPVNYKSIFNFGKISKFPLNLNIDNYFGTNFNLSSHSIGFRAKFAGIDFNIQNRNLKLFWSNFGYVGKVGENIWLVIMPDPIHIFSHQYSPISAVNYKYGPIGNPTKAASIEETLGIFSVIVDPYEELSDDLQILLDMVNALTIYGSTDRTNYPFSDSYVKSKYKSVYNLLSKGGITSTTEIYTLKCKFCFYNGIQKDINLSIYTNGIIGILDEGIPDYFPFNILTIDLGVPFSEKCIFIGEYTFDNSANDNTDIEDLKSLFSNNLGFSFRNNVLNDGNKRIGQVDWDKIEFFTNFTISSDYEKFLNCAEIFYIFSPSLNLISVEKNKSFILPASFDTDLKKNIALNKLVSSEGIFTKYWGYTPKTMLSGTENEIRELFQGTNLEEKPSIAFKGFSSQVILDPSNSIHDPSFTDFYFILTPGLNIYQPEHREIVSDMLTICENREGDCIYLAPIQSFIVDSKGNPNLSQLISFNDISAFFETDLIGSKYMAAIYPDVFITHPITGDKTVLDTGSTYLIKFGKLDKIYQSPAGSFRGVLDFINSMTVRLSKVDADKIYTNAHVNPVLKPSKFSLPQIEGNRMLYRKGSRVKSALSYVNVRGLLMFLIRALREILYTFKFEPNDPFLYTRFVSLITPTLDSLISERALYAYKLKNLTTSDDINKGRFIVGIGIQPTRETEIIEGRIYVFAAGSEIKFE